MPGDPLFHLTVTFALITGTAAGVLSLLSWEVFRHSAMGRVVFLFTVLMTVFILYHALLMVRGEPSAVLQALESLFYTGLAVFALLMLRVERQFGDSDGGREVWTPWR